MLYGWGLPAIVQAQHFGTDVIDSMYFAVGAIEPVPCNDGTFVGGALYCNRSSENGNISQRSPCADICINRSYDGGVTWVRERVDAPYHSSGTIVRVRDGVLLTADASMHHGFLRSTDHGRSWHRHIMSETNKGRELRDSLYERTVGDKLTRDSRGVLYWWYGAFEQNHISIDDGLTTTWVQRDTGNLFRPGWLSERWLFKHTSYGALASANSATPDFGRSYIFWDMEGFLVLKDTTRGATVDGFTMVDVYFSYTRNDSLVLLAERMPSGPRAESVISPRYVVIYTEPTLRKFRIDSTRLWDEWFVLPYESSCFTRVNGEATEPLFDSLGRMQFAGFTSFDIARDTCQRWTYRFVDGSLDTTTALKSPTWRHGNWSTPATVFYDLDGNLHSNSRNSFQHADHVRPVSMLDRLHTCGGMQFLVGGKAINGVTIAEQFTKNANITWTVTPNRRMVFIDVKAIDSTKALYVCFTVGDSLIPGMTYCDSSNFPTPVPTFRVGPQYRHVNVGLVHDVYLDPYDGWAALDYVGRASHERTAAYKQRLVGPRLDIFVRARDRNGCIRCSDTVSLRVVSVDERSDYGNRDISLTLALAPNPASGEVTMEFSTGRLGGAPYRIEVVDMLGTVVYTNESTMVGGVTNVATFSVAALPRGAYVVRIVARGSVASQVLLVQ